VAKDKNKPPTPVETISADDNYCTEVSGIQIFEGKKLPPYKDPS